MAKHGKKYLGTVGQVDRMTNYEPRQAVELVKKLVFANSRDLMFICA